MSNIMYERVMSHMWTGHGTHVNKLSQLYECVMYELVMYELVIVMYERVMSQMIWYMSSCITHGTHMSDTWYHAYDGWYDVYVYCLALFAAPLVPMSPVTHM